MSLINFTLTKIVLSQLKIIPNSPSRMSKLIWQASFPVPNKMKFQVFCVVPHIINLFKDTGQRDSEPSWGSQRLVNAYWRVQELAIGPDRWVRRSARPPRGSGKPAKVSERPVRGCKRTIRGSWMPVRASRRPTRGYERFCWGGGGG